MKFEVTVRSLNQGSDSVLVVARGKARADGQYSPDRDVTFEAPLHAGVTYRIGQRLSVEIKPL